MDTTTAGHDATLPIRALRVCSDCSMRPSHHPSANETLCGVEAATTVTVRSCFDWNAHSESRGLVGSACEERPEDELG